MQGGQAQNPLIFNPLIYTFLLGGWLIYVAFAPYYAFKSGLPQPADMIIALTAGSAILFFFVKERLIFNRVFSTLFLMVVMFFITNMAYFYFYKDTLFLLSSVYYVFNAMVFCAAVILFKQSPEKTLNYTRYAVFFSIAFEFIWLILFDSKNEYRETGSFNNPNQLGYWALLSVCYIMVLNYGRRMPWIDLIFFVIASYILTEALSRAVIIAYGLVFLTFIVGNYVSLITKIIMVGCVVFYSFFQITIMQNPSFLFNNFQKIVEITERLESISEEGSGVLEERGYDRIINHPEYLFFGAGEGAYWRFSDKGVRGLELHSGLGTILFSYGFLGFALFSAFILTILQRSPWPLWVVLAAIMAYGVTHQHVRFTGFWVHLALMYAMSRYIIPHLARESSHHLRPHRPQSLTTSNEGQTISNSG